MAKNKDLKSWGLKDLPRPTKANGEDAPPKEPDLLSLLEAVFLAPTLSLVQVYLYHSNGNKKTIENCTLDFRSTHPKAWKAFFFLDFLFRLVYMVIVLIVVIRGLAVGDYIVNLLGGK